jgi:hypothetical protein
MVHSRTVNGWPTTYFAGWNAHDEHAAEEFPILLILIGWNARYAERLKVET